MEDHLIIIYLIILIIYLNKLVLNFLMYLKLKFFQIFILILMQHPLVHLYHYIMLNHLNFLIKLILKYYLIFDHQMI